VWFAEKNSINSAIAAATIAVITNAAAATAASPAFPLQVGTCLP
jgi:hypothetical protein